MQPGNFSVPEFLTGGGEAGEIIRKKDWSVTPLGDPEGWPQSLKTCVRIILTSSQPMFVWWGRELINIYNDAYKEILGGKHPRAFAQPAAEVWKEIWSEIGPRAQTVMEQNTGTYDEALLLIMERNGYPEETYYTFSYSPIPGDQGGVGGIICANTNNTGLVINERSIQTLRDLATLSYNEKTVESVYTRAAEILHKNNKDFPFAIFYKIDKECRKAAAVAWAGDRSQYQDFPVTANLEQPEENSRNLYETVKSNQLRLVKNAGRRKQIPKGFWDIIPSEFLHVPITYPNKNQPLAVLTIGLNPYRQFNDTYKNFIKLVADQISLSANNVIAYEEERKRAEVLEEIDRTKTHFFSNISHEFRTPLTLILGPLESLLNNPPEELSSADRSTLRSVHRNTLRLLRLVNMLLEFSRIEAGRMEARYQPVDLTAFTGDLASSFRSMIENAGLKFNVSLEKLSGRTYVDPEMWEKIVLNLISNAFKYTLSGQISLSLTEEGKETVFRVSDTGIGIPEKELPRMFERFHRIQSSQGRSFEGTGIGLSLVYELVKLHGGTISVQSQEGSGSIFTVRLLSGKSHLAPQQVIERNNDYLSAALIRSYLSETSTARPEQKKPGGEQEQRTKVLVVDDNADMRDYIRNLLSAEYTVLTAVNGKDALEKIREEKPVLVLSDIMMPVMDGHELLHELKNNPATAHIPVIFLSARAGDEARMEGLQAGADDYLVKPFSAKEVLARIKAQIKLLQTRNHLNAQLHNLFVQAPIAICVLRGRNMVIEVANERMLEIWGRTDTGLNKPIREVLPEIGKQGFTELLQHVFNTGQRYISQERPVTLIRNGRKENIFVKFVFEALHDENGSISGIMVVADEITYQVMSKKILEASEKRYRHLIESLPIAIFTCNTEGSVTLYNQAAAGMWGTTPVLNKDKWYSFWKFYKTDGTPLGPENCPITQVLKQEAVTEKEIILEKKNGQRFYVQPHAIPLFDEYGTMSGSINMLTDVTEQKDAQRKIDENQLLFRTISNSAPVGLWITNTEGKCTFVNQTWTKWTGDSLAKTIEEGWFKRIVAEDKGIILEDFRKAFENKSYFKSEFRLQRADGKLRWCLTEGYPFRSNNGQFVGYAGSVTDITEKKNAQEELERIVAERTRSLRQKNEELKTSEEKYHRMTEEVQDYAIILLDREGTILNWNNGARKIKGYTDEEIIGKNFRIFYLPEDLESYLPEKLITQAVDTGRAVNEGWRMRKNGTAFWGSVVITALHDNKGNIIGFSKVTRDLTERKLAEDTTKKYMLELEKRNAELEQFAYVSSHDLQEPLRKIRTFSDLLGTMVDDETQRKYLGKINSSAERMSALIKDLLDYSRLSKDQEKFVPVDLNLILENIKTDLEVAIAQKDAVILHDELPQLKGIPLQFNQLFLNLLSNSLKFNTGRPVIRITSGQAPLYETVAAKLDPKWSYTRIAFSDNGIGFEPHYSDQIFTIFQRLNTQQKFSGTGIGLAMCKKIVDNHNGHIMAHSNPGEGATFVIYLPMR